jgi:hypothetical protein
VEKRDNTGVTQMTERHTRRAIANTMRRRAGTMGKFDDATCAPPHARIMRGEIPTGKTTGITQ